MLSKTYRVIQSKASFIFLARLFVSLRGISKILSLALKNIKASFIFLARLFVSLPEVLNNIRI